jgi:hypothetical protein
MLDPTLQFVWTWTVRAFVTLGGFAGVTKIIEWLFSGPRIIGEELQRVTAGESAPDGTYVVAALLMNLYLVNRRLRPITIRGFKLHAQVSGKWKEAEMVAIPDGFKIGQFNIDFAKSRLYEKAAINLLEYGKGINGWLRFQFPGEPVDNIRFVTYRVEIKDAFGKKHVIKCKYKKGPLGVMYVPDSGISHG